MTIPPKDWITVFKPWTKIKTGMKSFAVMREYFQWMSIYVEPEVYRAIYLFMRECLKQEQLLLFTNSYGVKHITLAEFEVIQTKHYTNVCMHRNLLDILYIYQPVHFLSLMNF